MLRPRGLDQMLHAPIVVLTDHLITALRNLQM